MRCPNCDRENRDVARFCQYCGASMILAEPLDAVEQEPPALDLESQPEPAQEPAAENLAGLDKDEWPASQATAKPAVEPDSLLQPETEPGQERLDEQPAVDLDETPATEASVKELTLEDLVPCDADNTPDPEADSLLHDGNTESSLDEENTDEDLTTSLDQVDATDVPAPDLQEQEPIASESQEDEVEPNQDLTSAEPEGLEPILPQETQDDEITGYTPEPEGIIDPDEPLAEVDELVAADLLPWSDRTEPTQATFQALEPGAVVNGRYQVIEVVQAEPDGPAQAAWYRVRDLQQCPRCGYTENSPDEAFCASCGALMEQKPVAKMLERDTKEADEPAEAQSGEYFEHNNHHYWVWQEMKQEPTQEAQSSIRLILGHQSDTGQVRELDEDSLFVLTVSSTYSSVTRQLGLFVVADGMGGHEGGEVASRIAIQRLAQELLRNVFTPELAGHSLSEEAVLGHLEHAVHAANERVYLERQKRENDMGTTLTVALTMDWALYLAHVGDCRAYRWGQDGLQQLTVDHSIVASMASAGTIQPDDIYTHPQRSVIYRSIGDRPAVEVDLSTHALSPDDRLVLCCDGQWEMIRNEGIEDVLLQESDPQTACDIMVEQANRAGGSDNISVIIVQFCEQSR